jgi:hypothetical protein
VEEVHRCAAKGVRGISMPELPHVQKLPSYRSDFWDPFWKAVCDEDMVVCLHIGLGLDAIDMGPEFEIDNFMVLATQVSVLCVQDLLWGRAMRDYPGLKFASRGRHRLDPVPARPRRPPLREPALDPTGLRRQAAERGVP